MAPMTGGALQGEDVWIPSVCGMCYNQCGILVHRVDGVVTKIEGNPKSPLGMGRLCPRGLAGIQLLYDPYRVNQPLKRGNPEKGIGVDPRWQPIGWDEALATIVDRLKQVRAEDPRKLLFCGTPASLAPLTFALGVFMPAFGSPNSFISGGHHCGNAEHMLARTLHGSITTNPDADFCEYLLLFGADCTSGTMAQKMADARVRGMRAVAVDPYLSPAAEKADEWLPIRPGTDGALACAMLNLLLNEYGLFDAEYIRRHTDGPYLVRPDGAYARDPSTGKPLVWDATAGRARPFDDEGVDMAVGGTYAVDGEECRPVFQLLREAVCKWTPEAAAEVTTIPAETIRRITREFGEAARIGHTVSIDGHELPLRPAAAVYSKGTHGHDNAWPTSLAIGLLNEVVGAINVPGGLLGCNPVSFGHPQTGLPRWALAADRDGLLQCGAFLYNEPDGPAPGWPPAPQPPRLHNWRDFIGWPITTCMTPLTASDDRFVFDYRPEVLINYGSNLLMSVANPEVCFEAFKDCFVISFNLYSDETAEALADIVLPDASYLERLDPVPNLQRHHFPVGLGDWGYQLRQPAVPPLFQRRHFSEVLLEIGERMSFADAMNVMTNLLYGLRPPHALNPEQRYSWEEMIDRIYQGWFGPEHGLAWFRENGVLAWPKRLEEAYWKPSAQARVPLYYEWLPRFGEEVRRIAAEVGLGEIDTANFRPLPDWRPCQALRPQPGFDLQAIYYRVPWHTSSQTYQNPWLDEVSQSEPHSYFICLNPSTAAAKGIADGDPIWVESAAGRRVRGRACLSQGVHLEVVAIANNGGHWARGMPVARGQGVFFNALLTFDLEHMDLVSLTIDCDACVRVYKE